MGEQYIGEIRMFTEDFAPYGWFWCDGSIFPVKQYPALAALLGRTYGGDGINNFGLPDLRDKVPMHQGLGPGLTNRPIGVGGGAATVTLTSSQISNHTHSVMCRNALTAATDSRADPTGNVWAGGSLKPFYGPNSGTLVAMNANAVGAAGSATPTAHNNLQPYLGINFAIAWDGIWPEQP